MTVDDPGQDVGEVGKRVDVVELAGLDQGRDDGPVFGAAVGSGKALMQRTQMEGGMPNPVRQRRSIESDALAGIDLGPPIQRQMIGIFGYRNLGDGCFRRQSAPRSTGPEPRPAGPHLRHRWPYSMTRTMQTIPADAASPTTPGICTQSYSLKAASHGPGLW